MLCVGMPQWTLRVRFGRDAERPGLHSHAERGNDQHRIVNDRHSVGARLAREGSAAGSKRTKKALIERSGLFHVRHQRSVTGHWQP
ncbi:hypothetical protein CES87_03090 [Pseudomonas sp. ERMR1:02]|nr:hypothetical protein CES87_03090 [Pseudomonas sp. ERMR1:02]